MKSIFKSSHCYVRYDNIVTFDRKALFKIDPKFLYPLQSKAFLTFAFITGESTPYQALLFNKSLHLYYVKI